jgi:hypothetical protein
MDPFSLDHIFPFAATSHAQAHAPRPLALRLSGAKWTDVCASFTSAAPNAPSTQRAKSSFPFPRVVKEQ